ncbi:hypothetical protein ACNS7O_03335 [Haloferacaceae archaeon DSL9]
MSELTREFRRRATQHRQYADVCSHSITRHRHEGIARGLEQAAELEETRHYRKAKIDKAEIDTLVLLWTMPDGSRRRYILEPASSIETTHWFVEEECADECWRTIGREAAINPTYITIR